MKATTVLARLIAHRTRRSPIGMDFGGDGIRGVQLSQRGEFWKLDRAARVDRTHGSEETAVPASAEIDECLELGGFLGRNVCTALGTPDLEFISLELPPALCQRSGAELNRAADFEMQRLLTADRGPVETRFWMVPAGQVPAPNAIGVAVSKRLVENLIGAYRGSGLFCNCVDTHADALCRFSLALGVASNGVIRGVLDLGCRQTRLVLCSDNVPVLVRAVGPGGKVWTARISEALSVSETAAEILKREHGLMESASDNGGKKPNELGSVLRGVLRADLNDLASEIKRSYEYILSCYPSRRAGDLVMVGSGAGLSGLGDFLGGLLGIRVRRASEYLGGSECRLECIESKDAPLDAFAVAIGAALDEDEA